MQRRSETSSAFVGAFKRAAPAREQPIRNEVR
jgi:hypothetical protein